jgi:hypothetical protein
MSPPANSKLIGRWRIVEADIWDRDYLDLCAPATITIGGRASTGCLRASYVARDSVIEAECPE